MKNVLTGIGIVLAVVLLILAFNFGKKKGSAGTADLKRQIDSIIALPPDTVTVWDTIFPEPEIYWYAREVPVPVPVPDQPEVNTYQDSLINEDIAVYVNDRIKGILLDRAIGYELFIPKTITETVTITEQVPVMVPLPVARNGVLFGAGLGGGQQFAWSIGMAYQKNDNQIGVDYLRFGESNNWLLSYKRLLFNTK